MCSEKEAIFHDWLSKNIDRFNVKLKQKEDEGVGLFYFEGVVENITLLVTFEPLEAMLLFDYNDDNFDIYTISCIGKECFDSFRGYYDRDRADKKFTYFSTKVDLYVQEVFEPMIEYINKMIVPENSLYLGDFEGSTVGFIAPSDETNSRGFHQQFTRADRTRKVKCIKYDLRHPKIRNF